MTINPNVFRAYDIRGIAEEDFDNDFVERLGKGLVRYSNKKNPIVIIGRDNRVSSPRIHKTLVKALIKSGAKVIDLGICTTPMYYQGIMKIKNNAGIMITASHNPREYNGFKINVGDALFLEKLQRLMLIMQEGEFNKGKGTYTKKNIWKIYSDFLKKNVHIKKIPKVVIDCGNGTGSVHIKKIMKLFKIKAKYIFSNSDGTFPNHTPDPSIEKYYDELKKEVVKQKADLGICYDGDVDRMGLISKDGKYINADMTHCALMHTYAKKGAYDIVDIKSSKAVCDVAKKLGLTTITSKTGHSMFEYNMKKYNAVLGAELSGHFYFQEEGCYSDGFYASLKALEIYDKLEEYVNEMPKYIITDEYRIETTDEKKWEIVKEITKRLSNKYKIQELDGLKLHTKNGWGLLRASNTAPLLSIRIEGKTNEDIEEIKKIFRDELKVYKVEF